MTDDGVGDFSDLLAEVWRRYGLAGRPAQSG